MAIDNASQKTDPGLVGLPDLAHREHGTDRGGALASIKPVGRTAITGIVPQTLDDVYRLAQAISKSGLAPKDMRSPEAITVAILSGLEVGLPPMYALQKISVINGRPTLWGDAIPGILWSKGFKIREWFDPETEAHCEITRPGGDIIVRSFGFNDAKEAGLWGKAGPWKQYPKRMLQMRARAFAARDGAADVLGGLYVAEEIQGGPLQVVEGHSEPFKKKSSAEAKRDGTTDRFNALMARIESSETLSDCQALRVEAYDFDLEAWIDMPHRWNDMLEDAYMLRVEDLEKQQVDL